MPKGSWLGSLAFVVLIDDWSTGCTVHKCVDDTTLCELVQTKQLDTHVDNLFNILTHTGS